MAKLGFGLVGGGIKAITNEAISKGASRLTYNSVTKSWLSPAGLLYGQGSKEGNRVLHVLEHVGSNPNKSIFAAERNELIGIIDEAWMSKGAPLANDPAAFIVNMGRIIGTNGETAIKLITRPGTNQIITAYPWR